MLVNDVYRPYVKPHASERDLLRVARISAVAAAASTGLSLTRDP